MRRGLRARFFPTAGGGNRLDRAPSTETTRGLALVEPAVQDFGRRAPGENMSGISMSPGCRRQVPSGCLRRKILLHS